MKNKRRKKAFVAAFPHTLPVMASFLFLGAAYGIYMSASGFSFVYPLITSLIVFGGSLEFLIASMLTAGFAPIQTALMALMIQARHLFYGVAMLEKYKGLGAKKPYLVFGLCDETFSINCSANIPADVDRGLFMFFVTLLDQIYWVTGTLCGSLIGSLLPFETKGIEFVMTAMFVVIFIEQWQKKENRISAVIGVAASLLCLIGFGADSFMIPAMLCMLITLTLMKKPIERGYAE